MAPDDTERLWDFLRDISDKLDNLVGAVTRVEAGAVDRQRQIDGLSKRTENLTKTVEQHGLSIDRHEQWLGLLKWAVVTIAVPVAGYIVSLVIKAVEHGVR